MAASTQLYGVLQGDTGVTFCEVVESDDSRPSTRLALHDPHVVASIFGDGAEPRREPRLTELRSIGRGGGGRVDNSLTDLTAALAYALSTSQGGFAATSFSHILGVGAFMASQSSDAWDAPRDVLERCVAWLETFDILDPGARMLCVAPRAALTVFRHVASSRHDAVVFTQSAELTHHTDARVILLALRPSATHISTLCQALRSLGAPDAEYLLGLPGGSLAATNTRGKGPVDWSANTISARAVEAEPREVIAGRYVLGEELGVGGFARVYKAYDQHLKRDVAIKVLLPELVAMNKHDARFLERFEREVALCAELDHAHLIQVYDTGKLAEGGIERPYLVMKMLDGDDLEHHLGRGPLAADVVHRIGRQALDALSYIHSQGIVHKDLKPANIFLTMNHRGEEHAYVMDFGISFDARPAQGRMTQTGAFVGTVQYLAPEYVLENRDDPTGAMDVFQMGLILAELLTGEPVIDHSKTLTRLIAQYIRKEPHRLPASFEGTRLGEVLERAIAFDPADRYPDASAFLAAWDALDPSCFPVVDEALRPPPAVAVAPARAMDEVDDGDLVTQFMGEEPGARAKWPLALIPLILIAAVTAGLLATRSGPADPEVEAVVSAPTAPDEAPSVKEEPEADVEEPVPPPQDTLVSSVPSGAEVTSGDEVLGVTPLRLDLKELGARRNLTLTRAGHDPATLTLDPDAWELSHTIELEPSEPIAKKEPARPKRGGKEKRGGSSKPSIDPVVDSADEPDETPVKVGTSLPPLPGAPKKKKVVTTLPPIPTAP